MCAVVLDAIDRASQRCCGTRRPRKAISAFLLLGLAASAQAQVPQLPPGAQSRWVVEGPEEVVGYLTFDTATIHARVPRSLRLVTIGELASAGRSWATAYLAAHPGHEDRGLSIVEIVHANVFAIDGREPNWPPHGAVALWFARVAWNGEPPIPGTGQPFLLLNLWVPDSSYVAFMRRRGYPAGAARVWLERGEDGAVRGAVAVEGLTIMADCRPDGAISGGPGSRGVQTFLPPGDSRIHSAITVAFAGHRIQDCREGAVWQLTGNHPLAQGTFVGSSSFEWGYQLVGGTYPLPASPLQRP